MAGRKQKNLMEIFNKYFVYIFLAILFLDLWVGSQVPELRWATKPWLLASLIVYLLINKKVISKNKFNLLLMGLVFSLAGDIFLLWDESLFFILGLSSFLLAHICYILLFFKDLAKSKKPYKIVMDAAIFVYAILLFNHLRPHLKDMLLPVAFYVVAILLMASFAILRKGSIGRASYFWVLMGALLFMASDSILAIDKFVHALPYASPIIMLTYAMAQFFIVRGITTR